MADYEDSTTVEKPQATQHGNVAFFYLPFVCADNIKKVREKLRTKGWVDAADQSKYLYPFVYQNLVGYDLVGPSPLVCHQALVTDATDALLEIAPDGEPGQHYDRKNGGPCVLHTRTHCYTFGTGIGILAFELSFLSRPDRVTTTSADEAVALCGCIDDPLRVAALLGRVYDVGSSWRGKAFSQGNRLRPFGKMGEKGWTLLEWARDLTVDLGLEDMRFFPYAPSENERAGVFVHVQCVSDDCGQENMPLALLGETDDYQTVAISYLASLWDSHVRPYCKSMDLLPDVFISSPDLYWGISQEAFACITYPLRYAGKGGRGGFVRGKLALNIEHEYQLMYVLLLHRKYAYLTMLSQLDQSTWNDMDRLRDFKQRLEELHADYVFGKVSDIPQYELLYERIAIALNLRALEDDIRDPIERLARLQQAEEEVERRERKEFAQREREERDRERDRQSKEQEERDGRLGLAMNLLALLAAVSAIVDGKQALGFFLEGSALEVAFWVYLVIIVVVVLYALYNLHKTKA